MKPASYFPWKKSRRSRAEKRVLFHTDAIQSRGENSDPAGGFDDQFSFALRAQTAWSKRRRSALREQTIAFKPSFIGGSQENNRRAGTENVASIVALGKAAECAGAALGEEATRVRAMRDRFEAGVLEKVPDTFVNGDRAARLPNTSNISFAGVESDAALRCCSIVIMFVARPARPAALVRLKLPTSCAP